MRTIICKKCGAEIDAALGECPNCGAVFYILPTEEDKKLEWAMSTDLNIDDTMVFGKKEETAPRSAAHSTRDIINADNDELFGARVWKQTEEADSTRVISAKEKDKAAATAVVPPLQRPVRKDIGAVRPAPANKASNSPEDKEKDIRKKWLAVSAVALVAVLTLALSIMGGLFNFSANDDSDKMPDVLGMPVETATTLLVGMGLEVSTMDEESTEPVGTVIKQSKKEGKKVKEGETITLTVSKGQNTEVTETKEYIDVPSLTGKTYEEARQELVELGLQITRAEDAFSEEEAGTVISQSPMKGARLQEGDLVTVTVSKGPENEEHEISVTAGKGGTVSPKGAVAVKDGEDQTFTITPDEDYEIREVKVDGTSVGALDSYTFTEVTEDHTLYVVFAKKTTVSPSPSASPTPTTTNPSSGTDITG